jgi:hypothetical protein
MKNILLFLALTCCQAVHAQNLLVSYQFSGNADDWSGNDNDGILFGNSYTNTTHILLTGQDTSSYMIIPANVFNGLQDFRIFFKGQTQRASADANYFFSASNPGCIRCFALSYERSTDSFRLELNGSVYHFAADENINRRLKLIRKSGILYLYNQCNLLGTVEDSTPLNITSIIVGQAEHCIGGCFSEDQLLRGGIDNFKVWDYAFFNEGCEDYSPKSGSSLKSIYYDKNFGVFPNPFSSSATISFSLEENSHTTIILFDLAGRKITCPDFIGETLLNENLSEGDHQLTFNRESLAAGIYFLQVKMNGEVMTRKVVIE